MARSRSSFDLDSAVATAAALAKRPAARRGKRASHSAPAGPPLVSFASRPPSAPGDEPELPSPPSTPTFDELAPSSDLLPSSRAGVDSARGLRSALPPSVEDVLSSRGVVLDRSSPLSAAAFSAPSGPTSERLDDAVRELSASRPLPRFPELSTAAGPAARCERVIAWITEVTDATDVFLADAAGLPLAGVQGDTEARLASSGLIASAVGSLVAALPGAPSQRFDLCVGDGPFFQLIGFQVSGVTYVVGLLRALPLTPREANAVRIACQHAIRDVVEGVR